MQIEEALSRFPIILIDAHLPTPGTRLPNTYMYYYVYLLGAGAARCGAHTPLWPNDPLVLRFFERGPRRTQISNLALFNATHCSIVALNSCQNGSF